MLSWVVGSRAEPELREAALQIHSLPDRAVIASTAAPEEPEPDLATEGDLVMTEDEAIVRYLSQEDRQTPRT